MLHYFYSDFAENNRVRRINHKSITFIRFQIHFWTNQSRKKFTFKTRFETSFKKNKSGIQCCVHVIWKQSFRVEFQLEDTRFGHLQGPKSLQSEANSDARNLISRNHPLDKLISQLRSTRIHVHPNAYFDAVDEYTRRCLILITHLARDFSN